MTGLGRTGRWFGVDHWDMRPDIITAGKGTTSGYVPFGFAAASGELYETLAASGFVHGFTWSHNALGRPPVAPCFGCSGSEISSSGRHLGERLRTDLPRPRPTSGRGRRRSRPGDDDRHRARPRPRDEGAVPASGPDHRTRAAAAREAGLLLYSSTGHVDGANGDLLMLGPPFCLSDDEATTLVERTAAAIRAVT